MTVFLKTLDVLLAKLQAVRRDKGQTYFEYCRPRQVVARWEAITPIQVVNRQRAINGLPTEATTFPFQSIFYRSRRQLSSIFTFANVGDNLIQHSASRSINKLLHGIDSIRVVRYPRLAVASVLLLVIWLAVLWSFPLLTIKLDELLRKTPKLKPSWLGGMELSVRYLVGVGFASRLDRMLSAWVQDHRGEAEKRFSTLYTVNARRLYIPARLEVNERGIMSPRPENIGELFLEPTDTKRRTAKRKRTLIWISGEGGSGKTSVAVQIGRWVLNEDTDRFGRIRMIPVLIENDLYQPEQDPAAFIKLVRDSLCEYISGPAYVSENPTGNGPHSCDHRRALRVEHSYHEVSQFHQR
jgi:hypothetical protein